MVTSHFLQSKEWEEFQRSVGREVFRVDGALIIKLPLIFGKTYFYCGGCLKFNFKQLGDLAKRENAVFLKLEPMVEGKAVAQELIKVGFTRSSKEVQPQRTIVLDLTESEEELLRGMHEKTRYNIGLAKKRGMEYRVWSIGDYGFDAAIESFWQLIRETSQRDAFSSHPKVYYEKLLRSFSSPHTLYTIPHTRLFTAEYQGETIAANIILFSGDTAYYLHGASSYEHRSLMAPYLLHWETIKYAKERGYREYDLWGIDEKRWPGVTRFKKGFGGKEVEYIGSYDYVFQPFWYKLYKASGFIKGLPRLLKAKSSVLLCG